MKKCTFCSKQYCKAQVLQNIEHDFKRLPTVTRNRIEVALAS